MLRRLHVPLAVVAVAACAGRAPAPAPVPAAAVAAPLQATLDRPFGREIRFHLSRPAYVAVFEIVPGRGASLLYPTPDDPAARAPAPAGYNVGYLPMLDLGRLYYLTAYPGHTAEPGYLYLVASDAPLDIAPMLRSPSALRTTLGIDAFARSAGSQLMDLIAESVAPSRHYEELVTDYVVLWDDSYTGHEVAQRPVVSCANGRLAVLDPDQGVGLLDQCEVPRAIRRVPPDSATPVDTATQDTTKQVPPPRARVARSLETPAADRGSETATLVVNFGADAHRRPAWADRSAAAQPARRDAGWARRSNDHGTTTSDIGRSVAPHPAEHPAARSESHATAPSPTQAAPAPRAEPPRREWPAGGAPARATPPQSAAASPGTR